MTKDEIRKLAEAGERYRRAVQHHAQLEKEATDASREAQTAAAELDKANKAYHELATKIALGQK